MKAIAMILCEKMLKLFPNTRVQNWIRLRGFGLFHDLPKEIVSEGEVVLHAGCWQIELLEDGAKVLVQKGKLL